MGASSTRAIARHVGEEAGEAEQAFAELVSWMRSKQTRALPLHEVERSEEEQIREVARLLLQEHINARGHGAVGHAVKQAEGQRLAEHRLRERGYVSIFGKVQIHRLAYGAAGTRSIVPLDKQLNLPQRSYTCSPTVRSWPRQLLSMPMRLTSDGGSATQRPTNCSIWMGMSPQ